MRKRAFEQRERRRRGHSIQLECIDHRRVPEFAHHDRIALEGALVAQFGGLALKARETSRHGVEEALLGNRSERAIEAQLQRRLQCHQCRAQRLVRRRSLLHGGTRATVASGGDTGSAHPRQIGVVGDESAGRGVNGRRSGTRCAECREVRGRSLPGIAEGRLGLGIDRCQLATQVEHRHGVVECHAHRRQVGQLAEAHGTQLLLDRPQTPPSQQGEGMFVAQDRDHQRSVIECQELWAPLPCQRRCCASRRVAEFDAVQRSGVRRGEVLTRTQQQRQRPSGQQPHDPREGVQLFAPTARRARR